MRRLRFIFVRWRDTGAGVLIGGSYCDKEEPAAFHGTSNAAVLSGAAESARNPPFSGGPFDAARAFG